MSKLGRIICGCSLRLRPRNGASRGIECKALGGRVGGNNRRNLAGENKGLFEHSGGIFGVRTAFEDCTRAGATS